MNLYSVYMFVIIMQNRAEIKGENWEMVYVLDGLTHALFTEIRIVYQSGNCHRCGSDDEMAKSYRIQYNVWLYLTSSATLHLSPMTIPDVHLARSPEPHQI